MRNFFLFIAVVLTVFGSGCSQKNKDEWKLVWSDEFNYNGLPDETKWNYDTGSNNGWGNNELEYYTYKKPANARIEN